MLGVFDDCRGRNRLVGNTGVAFSINLHLESSVKLLKLPESISKLFSFTGPHCRGGLLLPVLLLCSPVQAQEAIYKIPSSEFDRADILLHIPVDAVPGEADDDTKSRAVSVELSTGKTIDAQLGGPWLLDPPEKTRWLTCVVPAVAAGEEVELKWSEQEPSDRTFVFSDDKKTVTFMGTKVLGLEDATYDPSSKESRDLTYKVFHHVYSPRLEEPITKGPGGLYPHHRGLYFGFNKIGLDKDGQKVEVDTWHARKAHQESRGVQEGEMGGVFARQVIEVAWISEAHQPEQEFATELREFVIFPSSNMLGIQFSSRLSSKLGDISLKGDPQHAGFQFRASQKVADDTKDKTYYIRPDGIGKPGKFRNWPDSKDFVDLPFHAMYFEIDEVPFTCLRLEKAENPHPTRHSERDYGRFGSYFEYELTEEKPLELKIQLRLKHGEMDLQQAAAISNGFYPAK